MGPFVIKYGRNALAIKRRVNLFDWVPSRCLREPRIHNITPVSSILSCRSQAIALTRCDLSAG